MIERMNSSTRPLIEINGRKGGGKKQRGNVEQGERPSPG
jgi:hypothetical protein